MLLGYIDFKNEYNHEFDLKPEELPGAFIIQREIIKALDGKDFFINDDETGKPIRLVAIPIEAFWYYYKIWENYHYFGLPHGQGWSIERSWLLEFLKTFERTNTICTNYVEYKMSKKNS